MFVQVDVGVTLYACIREVPSLNLSRVPKWCTPFRFFD
jgi:hypothetical protein